MGGCEGGQIASRIAVDTVHDAYFSPGDLDPQQRLVEAFRSAHARIHQRAMEQPLLHGMGTTVTAFALVDKTLSYAHVGDSRLYLLRAGKLQALTRDHSLVARLVENGVIRAQDADSHPQRHVLTAAVGVSDDIQPNVPEEPVLLENSDVLLLCTDGLWGQMTEAEISQILASRNPQDACRELVQLAKAHGGPDNITVQVLRVL
jgi:protein phosphatase